MQCFSLVIARHTQCNEAIYNVVSKETLTTLSLRESQRDSWQSITLHTENFTTPSLRDSACGIVAIHNLILTFTIPLQTFVTSFIYRLPRKTCGFLAMTQWQTFGFLSLQGTNAVRDEVIHQSKLCEAPS
ncbi:hypothetical protein [Helicobacter sp.]|uniref:hypothetical protein n=1 Tax=Helicobacter sp. TaxID=218 RepID=UPI0025B8561C|nr:hypothetical protein [Helicobacter sp.]MCI5633728.1 hypothetical protein [Helicobacter sp.]